MRSQTDAERFIHKQRGPLLFGPGDAAPACRLVSGLLQGPADGSRVVVIRMRQHDDLHGIVPGRRLGAPACRRRSAGSVSRKCFAFTSGYGILLVRVLIRTAGGAGQHESEWRNLSSRDLCDFLGIQPACALTGEHPIVFIRHIFLLSVSGSSSKTWANRAGWPS